MQGPAAAGGAAAALNPGEVGAGLPAGVGWRVPGLTFALPTAATGGGEAAARRSAEDERGDAERSLGSVSSVEVRSLPLSKVRAATCSA